MPMILGTNSRAYRPEKWMGAVLWAACSLTHGQSLISSLSVNSPGSVNIDIQQTGAARLGMPNQPLIVNGSGTGTVTLQVTQVADPTNPAAARIEIHTEGNSPIRFALSQATASHTAVGNVFADLRLGTQSAGSGHAVTLLQQGSDATGSLELTRGDNLRTHLVQGAGSALTITTGGSYNIFGTAIQPFTVAAGSSVNISNQGDYNSYGTARQPFTVAVGSTVNISSQGNFNNYGIATQASGDSLSLHIKGNGNTFNFDFPLAGADAYKALSWGLSSAPAEVNGGNFAVARYGSPGSYFYAVYDNNNTNAVQAASAVVTPR